MILQPQLRSYVTSINRLSYRCRQIINLCFYVIKSVFNFVQTTIYAINALAKVKSLLAYGGCYKLLQIINYSRIHAF